MYREEQKTMMTLRRIVFQDKGPDDFLHEHSSVVFINWVCTAFVVTGFISSRYLKQDSAVRNTHMMVLGGRDVAYSLAEDRKPREELIVKLCLCHSETTHAA